MASVGVGLLGCGVVGSAVVRGMDADAVRGRAGPVLAGVAVRDVGRRRSCPLDGALVTDAAVDVVADPAVDIVVEVMGGLEPARSLIERAIDLGKPVVTANKAVLGAFGPRLRAQAVRAGVPLLFEGAVGGGIPVIRALDGLVAGDRVLKLEGVLNGTANFVLSHMEALGVALPVAAQEARRLGYAEADPSRDLDGTDTADKLAILAQHVFGSPLLSGDIPCRGIDHLTPTAIAAAAARGRRWRLVATADRGRATVEPLPLRVEHPLARLNGAENGLLVTAERAGPLLLCGAGAGGDPTASAVLADIASAVAWVRSNRQRSSSPDPLTVTTPRLVRAPA